MDSSQITHSVHNLPWFRYTEAIVRKDYIYTTRDYWGAEIDHTKITLPDGLEPLVWETIGGETNIVFSNEHIIGLLEVGEDRVTVRISANHNDYLEGWIEKFKAILIPLPDVEKGKIHVRFWYNTNNGPEVITRTITAPAWDDIESNYVASTRKELVKLIHNFKPAHGGQLILWHGDPGSGKTYSLRALCDAWRDWCSIDYIVDPERFLDSPSYLMHLLGSQHDGEEIDWEDGERIITDKSEKWKLLILEDAGDFLAIDARNKTGQALSRLLNVADGFIGQGLKILILITTNEELEKLHSAVSRPGRSAAVIAFNRFTGKEAEEWLHERGVKWGHTKQDYSLAELFAVLKGYEVKTDGAKKKEFGFGRI